MLEDRDINILIVDDNPHNLRLLTDIVTAEGYHAHACENGVEALLYVNENPPDLILLDIMMPDLDGYDVCRQLKANKSTASIPVIFITARVEDQDELEGFGVGAVDYITKPIRRQRLLARVRLHVELAQSRRQLAEQNKQLIEAAALREQVERITRHDMKNPLNAIIGFSTILSEDISVYSTDEIRSMATHINRSSYDLLEMIERSLDLYKMETGQYKMIPQPFDLAALLRRLWLNSAGELEDLSMDCRITIDGQTLDSCDSCTISGEELLVYSLLANLVRNAVEASPEGVPVDISVATSDDQARIAIHNQGAVPREIRGTFFDKFVTAGKERGTGLGTYSAKLITRAHGGEIAMQTSDEEGTTVTVTLPRMLKSEASMLLD